jgi:hypothetical protein
MSQRLKLLCDFSDKRFEGDIGGMLYSIHNAFLIDSRKMIDFFYNSSDLVFDNDLIADDYFETPKPWRILRPTEPDVLRRAKEDVGKMLAHFTYRVNEYPDGRVSWETSHIYVEVFTVLQKFLAEVDRSLVDEQLDFLRMGNPNIVICYPLYPPEYKAPFQIGCPNDKAAGFEINSQN